MCDRVPALQLTILFAFAGCLAACGGGAAGSLPAHATSPTPAAAAMSTVRSEYVDASRSAESHAVSFRIELNQALQQRNGQTLYAACQGFWGAMEGFDTSLRSISMPPPLTAKEQAVLHADAALERDLQMVERVPARTWVSSWVHDLVRAQTAHDVLTSAVGVPPDTFLTGLG